MNFLAAPLYAVAVSVLFAIALGFRHGGLDAGLASLSLSAGAAVAACALASGSGAAFRWRSPGAWGWAAIALFALFSLRAFLWLIFRDGDAIKVLSPNNLGDMSLHLTYIHQLAGGAPFWPDNPILAGTKLTYPLGVDLFNSLLLLLGVDVIRGLVWVGLIGCVLTGAALWRWGGAFTLAGFLCNGGLLGFEFLRRCELLDYQSEAAWPDGFPAIGWKSLPLALFVTQRGFLFALPAGLLLLCSWRARLFAKDATGPRLPLWGEVLLYGSMPIFHLHTFIFLSFVLGVWFLTLRSARPQLAILGALALLPATALVLLVTGMFKGASVVAIHLGWMQGAQGFLTFWFANFGILPLLVAALCVVLVREKRGLWPAAIVFPALGIFLLCCVVKFAPWEWDNTKLMIWSYLAVLPFLWTHLLARWPASIRAATCAVLFFSGLISLLGGLGARHRGHEIAARSELNAIAGAVRGIPATERFVGAPTYNHPLLLLGRPMALGYTGHVWSHGFDFTAPLAKVESLMNGDPQWRRHVQGLGVRYVFWGPREREQFPASTEPWRAEAALIAAGEWGELYDLRTRIPIRGFAPSS